MQSVLDDTFRRISHSPPKKRNVRKEFIKNASKSKKKECASRKKRRSDKRKRKSEELNLLFCKTKRGRKWRETGTISWMNTRIIASP